MFLLAPLSFFPTSWQRTAPHKTKRRLTNCDCSLIGLPLGITPNGCCAERLASPPPTAMEACQAMQVTFITPWMRALPFKEDTSNLFLLSKKELLIWREEEGGQDTKREECHKADKHRKHAPTGCQSGLRRCSWICGCSCCWCGLLVFPACLWL